MAQVTIYINSNLEERIKIMAGALDISLSKLISSLLEEKFSNEWHPSVKQLAGSWKSFPSLSEIRETTGKDAEREPF